jgi:RNA polymerase sigma factor (sigma-70 family)
MQFDWKKHPASATVMPAMATDEFTQLVDAHYQALFRFAFSLAKNAADAGDLTQQTFLIWAERGHGLRDRTKAKTWLFSTLYREFLRGRRQAGRMTAWEDLDPQDAEPPAVENDFVAGLDAGSLADALQQIDEVYRAPLLLFCQRDLSYKEMAEVLDVPVGTVMSRLSRGKAQLRTVLLGNRTGGAAGAGPGLVPARNFS